MNLRERLGYVRAASAVSPRLTRPATVLPPSVKLSETKLGDVFFAEQHWPLDHFHGGYPLGEALQIDEVALARVTESWTTETVRNAVYLDIETSGLSGGTGTYAFLVGLGTFEAYSFRVRQYFLADPSGEAAMLSAIGEVVAAHESLVTFNGRTFDVPQLATRFALKRLPGIDAGLPHLDLLFPARRLYGKRMDSCRLQALEQALLGLQRDDDVPSWLIPSLYFSYIRYGRAQGLHPVFQHNALDVLSLVTCLAHIGKVAGRFGHEVTDHHHLLALGRWDEGRGQPSSADSLLESAAMLDRDGDAGAEAVRRLGRLRRREKQWEEQEAAWQEENAKATSPVRRAVAAIELAKIREHRHRDYAAAEALALAARVELLALERYQRPLSPTLAEVEHRLDRLRRRLTRTHPVDEGV